MLVAHDVIEQWLNGPWFEHCGEKDEIACENRYQFVPKSAAKKKILGLKWQNTTLEKEGDVHADLFFIDEDVQRMWNHIVDYVKDNLWTQIYDKVAARLDEIGFAHEAYMSTMQFDIVLCTVVLSYRSYRKSSFWEDMLRIYMSGHVPCGWREKDGIGYFEVY